MINLYTLGLVSNDYSITFNHSPESDFLSTTTALLSQRADFEGFLSRGEES